MVLSYRAFLLSVPSRVFVSCRGNAGFLEPSGLLGICGSKSVVWLEYLVGFFNRTDGESPDGRQINSGDKAPTLNAKLSQSAV